MADTKDAYTQHETLATWDSVKGTAPRDPPEMNGNAPGAAASDVGLATWAARRYLRTYGGLLRYVHAHRRWLHWSGQYWQRDQLQEAARLGQELIGTLYADALNLTNADSRKDAMKHVARLDTASSIHGIASLAAQWDPIRGAPDAFDRDPWLATVANGTLDLRLERSPDGGATALLREHRQADMLTRRLGKREPLAYKPDATCPNWLALLDHILVKTDGAPDTDLIAYLRRWGGYTLTGLVTEQMLLVCYGTGQNGKRTFTQALEEVLGDYAETISIETLLAQRFEGNAGPAELARLDGARFVQCGENDAGRSLNEARVKLLTGGDPITARHLRGDPFAYDPQFKLLLHTNHKPKIRGTDKAIWRRVKLIPFSVTIPDSERDPLYFEHKLRAELPGIFAWFVGGCLDWQRLGGLCEPPTVTAATAAYRDAEDIVKQFAAETLVRDATAAELQKTVHELFVAWCEREGIRQRLSSRALADRVRESMDCDSKHGERGQVFVGVRLRMASDDRREKEGAGANGKTNSQ